MANTLPSSPAEVAGAVLDAIEANPGAFDMSRWVDLPQYGRFTPDEAPNCYTTMCAAGWAAHLTGWTLVQVDEEDLPEDADDSVWAEKDGQRELVCEVARVALGLENEETFWFSPRETAIERLREIAGRTA